MKLLLPIPCRSCEGFSHFEYLAYLWTIKRADERTRTTDLTSLGVITQALQGCAEACKSRIFRRLPLLRVAACCTVLRSPIERIESLRPALRFRLPLGLGVRDLEVLR